MTKFKKINNEVFYAEKLVTEINGNDLTFLKNNVKNTQKKRIRICTHLNEEESLQEMFIVLSKESYIRPHKHINKSESLHVLEGAADVVFFDDEGKVLEIITLTDYSSYNCFYYRINKPMYHTLLVTSDVFIFHETTQGPFRESETIKAPWSPLETNVLECKRFNAKLKKTINT